MGLVELASGNSVWRGLDYYENKKVISWKKLEEGIYSGMVAGSQSKPYMVYIDKNHPRKSSCNCPFANGRRVICKHMIALLFTAEPACAEEFMKQVEEYEAEEEERVRQHYEELKSYVESLSKKELQTALLNALIELEERTYY